MAENKPGAYQNTEVRIRSTDTSETRERPKCITHIFCVIYFLFVRTPLEDITGEQFRLFVVPGRLRPDRLVRRFRHESVGRQDEALVQDVFGSNDVCSRRAYWLIIGIPRISRRTFASSGPLFIFPLNFKIITFRFGFLYRTTARLVVLRRFIRQPENVGGIKIHVFPRVLPIVDGYCQSRAMEGAKGACAPGSNFKRAPKNVCQKDLLMNHTNVFKKLIWYDSNKMIK